MKNTIMLWDIGLDEISRMMDIVAPIGYKRVQYYSMIGRNMQSYSLAIDSVQWICGVFPLGRDINRVLKKIIDLGLPKIGELIGKTQEVGHTSMIDLHLGYH